MKSILKMGVAAVCANLILPTAAIYAQAPATSVGMASEDARLTAFLDAEFNEYLKQQPQVATRLGLKNGGDR